MKLDCEERRAELKATAIDGQGKMHSLENGTCWVRSAEPRAGCLVTCQVPDTECARRRAGQDLPERELGRLVWHYYQRRGGSVYPTTTRGTRTLRRLPVAPPEYRSVRGLGILNSCNTIARPFSRSSRSVSSPLPHRRSRAIALSRSTRRSAASFRRTTIGRRVSVRRDGCPTARPTRCVERSGAKAAAPTSSATTPPPAARTILVAARGWCRPAKERPLDIDDYAWSADAPAPADLHQHAQGLAPQHARRLLGARHRVAASCTQLGGKARPTSLMFAKFSPDATRVGLRARQRPLRRAAGRRRDHAADHRRIGDDHQRHLGLGLRRGARGPRRLPLEPRRPPHRLLAVRHAPASASSR